MIKNYFKAAFRHLWKNKMFSGINIIGLGIALAAVTLSILYYKDEHGFDSFHKNSPHLFRITTSYTVYSGETRIGPGTAQVQGPAFKAQVPEILDYVRIYGDVMENIKSGDKAFNIGTSFVDSSFFKVFSFPLLSGDKNTVLNDIHSVVVSEKTALKFFNTTDVIGKRLDMEDTRDSLFVSFVITGVAKDPPHNSSIQFDILIPFGYLQTMFDDKTWLNNYLPTFVTVQPGADLKRIEQRFASIHNTHAKAELERSGINGQLNKTVFKLQSVTGIHLSREGGFPNASKPSYSYFLLGISIFILVMASINFINLSIAGSLKRAKEIGVRKINGSSKSQIIYMFLVESGVICFAALLAAAFLTEITLPFFNRIADKQLIFFRSSGTWLLLYLAGLLAINTILAGFYPAFVLAKFKPTEVLYNKQTLSSRNLFGRSLVVFQFSLSVCLIVCSIVYYKQMSFMQTKDLGYNPDNIIRIDLPPRRETKLMYTRFKNELAKERGIKELSLAAHLDGEYKTTVNEKTIASSYGVIDEYYIPMLEIPLKEGRNFSLAYGTDRTNAAVVNEAFVRAAGLKKPIGQLIYAEDWFVKGPLTIVGVVKDYHHRSLREVIHPMVFTMNDQVKATTLLVKINKASYQESLAALERAYKQTVPGSQYAYAFWTDLNAKEYTQERKWQQIITIATGLSILICCLGLFGLSNLATHQRTKEIGIRKVLGASVASIASLLSRDFLKLVMIGFVIASPLAWWIMNSWLRDFAYRINIAWWIFLLAGVLIVFIALVTVCLQTIKAAMANPVKSLRTE